MGRRSGPDPGPGPGPDSWRPPPLKGIGYGSVGVTCKDVRRRADDSDSESAGRMGIALVASLSAVLVVSMLQLGIWVVLAFGARGCAAPPRVVGTATVDLTYTTYEGLRLSNGVNAFLGMRYAAAPLGDLRWRAPVEPVRTGAGTVERATTYPPICLSIGVAHPASGQGEDCLFVNVWAPTNATGQSKLPVWVFIQGGGYTANTNANWDGNEVVQWSGYSIVMVNFNYRVGLWGFLASERVRADGALNAGLLDQRMLLKWVKTQIAHFGGDASHVVIHGASAGAGSVAMHLAAYGGRNDDLFVGAMAESIFFPAQPPAAELEYQFDRVARQTGCDEAAPAQRMVCLRGKDVAVLQAANYAQPFPGRSEPPLPLFYWTPCSVFAPDAAAPSDIATFFLNNHPLLTPNDTTAILAHYPHRLPPLPRHQPWFPTASQAYGDATFVCPQHNVLTYVDQYSAANNNNKLYAYRYNVRDDENLAAGLGVPHLFDAAAIFRPDNIRGGGARASYGTYNAPVVPLMMGYWISFVRGLDPNLSSLASGGRGEGAAGGDRGAQRPVWERWDGLTRGEGMKGLVVETGGAARIEGTPRDETERCAFWLGLGRGRMQQK
ncbi:Alpha/Beta hydrolase protein [Chaetomium strumarium]|uniref:Carboxylic ester hydrolase n=1 Tax=Chaetomium strumarium TaxID=1170767 RepID=A0AAJ0M6V2_9PEZI|nr:Alpha/Beta hydrolase protein [Chaetomium strumarium]